MIKKHYYKRKNIKILTVFEKNKNCEREKALCKKDVFNTLNFFDDEFIGGISHIIITDKEADGIETGYYNIYDKYIEIYGTTKLEDKYLHIKTLVHLIGCHYYEKTHNAEISSHMKAHDYAEKFANTVIKTMKKMVK